MAATESDSHLADATEPKSDQNQHQHQDYGCDCGHDASDQESDGDESDKLDQFSEILATVALDKVPQLAVRIRKQLLPGGVDTPTAIEPATVATPPLCGSYHVLFRIDFADGVRWLLKVPGIGTRARWDHAGASSLACEALTMQLISRETTVPVPLVYSFSSDIHDELGVPFILMEWIDGCSLQDVWFDFHASEGDLRARRTRTLRDIATAMVQLQRFSSDRGGALEFDADGTISGIGPFRIPDSCAMLQRLDDEDDDPDDSPIFAHVGPFNDTESYYRRSLSAWESRDAHWVKCDFAILELFLGWMLEHNHAAHSPDSPAFVLTHPDLDIQNVLVDPNSGAVKAIIDWDGAHLKPRSIGNEAYPSWLTRDWDPAMYAYESGMESEPDPQTMREDSPTTLKLYRDLYAKLVQTQLSLRKPSVGMADGADIPALGTSVTRQSIVFENLAIAVDDRVCAHEILVALFDSIKAVVADELVDMKYEHRAQSDGADATNVLKDRSLRQADATDASVSASIHQDSADSVKINSAIDGDGDRDSSESSGGDEDQRNRGPTEYVPFVNALLRGGADPMFVEKLHDGFARLMAGEKGLV